MNQSELHRGATESSDPVALSALFQACTRRRPALQISAETLGWGLLGASAVAQQYTVGAIRSQPPLAGTAAAAGAWVAAIFSHNERRARAFADQNGIATACVNLSDLLERRSISCVYVSSHPRHHYPLAMSALAAGKHVLCEPPLGMTLDEARSLQLAAADRGLVLAVNFVGRANPAVYQLGLLLQADELGDVIGGCVDNLLLLPPHRQTWRLQASSGGILYDRTLHDIDVLRYLFRDEITHVFACRGQRILKQDGSEPVEEELLGHFLLRRHRIPMQFHTSYLVAHRPSALTLDGTQRSARVTNWLSGQATPTLTLQRHDQQQSAPLAQWDPFWLAILSFQAAVTLGQQPLATAQDGVQSLAVAQALRRSLDAERVAAVADNS